MGSTEPGQISVFDLLGERRTPLLRPEDARAGQRAWKLESEAWAYGLGDDRIKIVYLRAIRVVIEEVELESDGTWAIYWKSDDVEISCGGVGNPELYARRPEWEELLADFKKKTRLNIAGAPVVPWVPRSERGRKNGTDGDHV